MKLNKDSIKTEKDWIPTSEKNRKESVCLCDVCMFVYTLLLRNYWMDWSEIVYDRTLVSGGRIFVWFGLVSAFQSLDCCFLYFRYDVESHQ